MQKKKSDTTPFSKSVEAWTIRKTECDRENEYLPSNFNRLSLITVQQFSKKSVFFLIISPLNMSHKMHINFYCMDIEHCTNYGFIGVFNKMDWVRAGLCSTWSNTEFIYLFFYHCFGRKILLKTTFSLQLLHIFASYIISLIKAHEAS